LPDDGGASWLTRRVDTTMRKTDADKLPVPSGCSPDSKARIIFTKNGVPATQEQITNAYKK